MIKKFKKSLIATSSILAVAGISATVATTFTSCSSTNNENKVVEMIDDYQIEQARYDFDEFASMIISPRSEEYIKTENNGVLRSDLKIDEVNSFFNQLIDIVHNGLQKTPTVH
jgi:hypothetical protein